MYVSLLIPLINNQYLKTRYYIIYRSLCQAYFIPYCPWDVRIHYNQQDHEWSLD
jgi:hypothetical protein